MANPDNASPAPATTAPPRSSFERAFYSARGLVKNAAHHGLRLLPIDWCSSVGALGAKTAPARYPDSDRRARKVFRRLRAEASDPAWLDAAMKRLWRNIGRTMAEYSVLDRLWDAGRIEVEGVHHFDAAKATGKPRIIIGLHLGNWEVIGPALIRCGHPVNVVYLRPDSEFEHQIVIKVRNRYGVKLVTPTPYSPREAIRILQKNEEAFGIYVDEFARNRVHAPAFGRGLQASGNIAYVARLALMTGALVLPIYAVRVGDRAQFKVTFLPALDMVDTGAREADVIENIRRIDALIEPIIRGNLDQWYYVLDLKLDEHAT
jgi:Kdo2-lipid IVA lauroyltransferase/acyltransferase